MPKPQLRAVDNEADYELRGWIQPCELERTILEAQQELESLGVDVGPWDSTGEEFQHCVVTGTALAKLDPLWGQYIWGLLP